MAMSDKLYPRKNDKQIIYLKNAITRATNKSAGRQFCRPALLLVAFYNIFLIAERSFDFSSFVVPSFCITTNLLKSAEE